MLMNTCLAEGCICAIFLRTRCRILSRNRAYLTTVIYNNQEVKDFNDQVRTVIN